VQDYHRLKRRIEKATEKLASLRAWKAFFDRLDEKTVQSLIAWTKAVDRIGKGTGKHAHRHRRTARQYLMECVPRIPAWIMPLHKLWDSVRPVPGVFDTVIVDEASQAGVDALLLLLLAKRIVVVGDDKQNSPEAVGVLEDDIARLAREHLNEFRFRDEFRPDASLFDHAERTFWSHITLREHFRCVPEIIRFSNDLCYRDAPLIPLRQAPPERLPPLRSRFVAEGACEGGGERIVNRAEAEALVETIVKLIDDEAYEGKTMGVIALQGHAQARLIERLLAQRLEPRVIEERRLRCGEPATFQGDERDVIFLSLVIAPNVRYRALTRLPDQRRFNVAMSRARDQVWLFHSIRPHDLSPDDLRGRLIRFFESPQAMDPVVEDLNRLEREARKPRRLGSQPDPYESWFEVDVALELLRRRYRVRPQVEVAGYRIDLVVEGLDARLAVECDGEEWHGPEQYEHDMARQRQLERAGWTFVRVRESDFYADRQRAMTAVVEACEELGIRPVDFRRGNSRRRDGSPCGGPG
jgi:very-short-patch-repair endonuclease